MACEPKLFLIVTPQKHNAKYWAFITPNPTLQQPRITTGDLWVVLMRLTLFIETYLQLEVESWGETSLHTEVP